jgi:hypothetical protein
VHEVPAFDPAVDAGGVPAPSVAVALDAGDAFAGATLDPPELLTST